MQPIHKASTELSTRKLFSLQNKGLVPIECLNCNFVLVPCGWRGYEREEKEGEREVDNLSTCGCVIQLYLWENTRFIEIREFGWGFLMLTS